MPHRSTHSHRIIGLTVGVGLLVIAAVGIGIVLNKTYAYNDDETFDLD